MNVTTSRFFSFLIAFWFAIGCSSTSSIAVGENAAQSFQSDSNTDAKSQAPIAPSAFSAAADAEIPGCDLNWKRDARLKAVNAAVEKSDIDTQNVTDGFVNSNQRNRLAILSAGLLPDDVPFVTLDRSCWSEFYRAHQTLRDGKDGLAKKAASRWRVCLDANFPDRSKQAQALYRCFGLAPQAATDDSTEESEE